MDFHGNINLKSNEMQSMVFQQESSFPVDAVVGSVVFNGNVLYMSVAIGNDSQPVWIPLTTTIDTFVHTQESAATTWTVTHSLGASNPLVQIYDDNHEMIIPDTITPTDTLEFIVTFGTAVSGVAIVMSGDEIPANGVGIIEPVLAIVTLLNPTPATNDNFGMSIDVSGSNVVVGAPGVANISFNGIAYIYNAGTGVIAQTLINPDPNVGVVGDSFGFSVAIFGNNTIVGAPNEDVQGATAGHAYLFDVTTGVLLHTIVNPSAFGTPVGDTFGEAVAITGNHIIIGAPREDDGSGLQSGKAYIFDVDTVALLHTLDNPNVLLSATNDFFGRAVAMTDTYAVVGAPNEDDAINSNSGTIHIFDTVTGNLLHSKVNPGLTSLNEFGISVAIDSTNVVVGSPGDTDRTGIVYVYNASTGALIHTFNNPNPLVGADDKFGKVVSIDGDNVLISAPETEDAGGEGSGKAYLFDLPTGNLLQTYDNPNNFGTGEFDFFGHGSALSSSKVVIAARGEDTATSTTSGIAYVYGV